MFRSGNQVHLEKDPAVKYLLSALGSAGDLHPMMGIATTLAERGHDVALLATPYFAETIRKAGLEHIPLGTAEEFESLTAHPDLWHPRRGLAVVLSSVADNLRAIYELIEQHYVPGETVYVAHMLDLAARIAQEKLGMPTATVALAPAVFRSLHRPPRLPPMITARWTPRWMLRAQYWLADRLVVDPLLESAVNDLRRDLGLPPVGRFFDRWWFSPQCVMGLFPDWFAPPQRDWPPQVQLAGFPLWDERSIRPADPEVEAFLAAGDAPIVFTPGSANMQGAQFFQAAIDALQRLGRRGLLLSKYRESLPAELPSGVRHFSYVPFSSVLPRAAAVVHHGGIGSVAQGLAAGNPQLVMPMAHDQHDNSLRVRELGVGDSVLPARFRGARVAQRLKPLIESEQVQVRCRELGGRIAHHDGLAAACDILEQLAPDRAAAPADG